MDLVLWNSPKFGQGGRGSKNPKILQTSFMYGPKGCSRLNFIWPVPISDVKGKVGLTGCHREEDS